MHFDVIIIGAGPAGSVAAICCRQYGLHTLLITGKAKNTSAADNEAHPSESIHPGVLSLLSQLNAAHCVELASKGCYEGITVNNEFHPLGNDENGAWQGQHINRLVFDAALLQTAVEKGVDVMNEEVSDLLNDGDRITGVITKSGEQITAKYSIDASGHKRFAGKKLLFRESFFSPPLVVWTGLSRSVPPGSFLTEKKATQFIPHAKGWTWLAPESSGGCTWTKLEIKGQQKFLPPVELQADTEDSKIIKSNRRWALFRPVCKEGILLCGDAAGIIDPAAGQGILNAVISASRAAKTIKDCISNPDFEALYLAQYDNWFSNDYEDRTNRLKHFYELHGIKIF